MFVHCPSSRFRTAADSFPLTCPLTGAPVEFAGMPQFDPGRIDPARPGHWRYLTWLQAFPAADDIITLGEGWTPLLTDQWQGREIRWKMDSHMPTGSYKDRGVSVMVNWFRRHGFHTVMDDSSGNAGASLACYAARANLRARIFVPKDAPEPKKSQIAIYGSELVEVEGPRYLAAAAAAAAQNREVGYASHALHPAFLLGQMSVAWEIWEQLGQKAPDWLIGPAGNGGLMLGAWRGFELLYHSVQIPSLPKLLAVQAESFDPVFRAFVDDRSTVEPIQSAASSSAADGISIINPARGNSLLTAIYQSQGLSTTVTDAEILAAQREMAASGLFVEPTSAAASAAFTKHVNDIAPDAVVVIILSGTGLKNPPLA